MDDPLLTKHMAHRDMLSFISAMLRDGLSKIQSEPPLQTASKMEKGEGLSCKSEKKVQEDENVEGMECSHEGTNGVARKKKKKKRRGRKEGETSLTKSAGEVEEGRTKVTLDVVTQGLQLLGNIWYV